MKFTWGHAAIVIPVVIVVVFTTVLIVSLSEEHQTELVTDNYYAKELQFQDQIDQTKNALLLSTEFLFDRMESNYVLSLTGDFNPSDVTGTVLAFRPSDSKMDFETVIDLDSNGTQLFPRSHFSNGQYQIQISWNVEGKDCYLEKNIFIQ